VRPLRTTRVAAWDIYRIEGILNRGYRGADVWSMRVRHARGRIRVDYFDDAPAFLALVQTHHPGIQITGLWPMPMP
jgi:hypothetical protein